MAKRRCYHRKNYKQVQPQRPTTIMDTTNNSLSCKEITFSKSTPNRFKAYVILVRLLRLERLVDIDEAGRVVRLSPFQLEGGVKTIPGVSSEDRPKFSFAINAWSLLAACPLTRVNNAKDKSRNFLLSCGHCQAIIYREFKPKNSVSWTIETPSNHNPNCSWIASGTIGTSVGQDLCLIAQDGETITEYQTDTVGISRQDFERSLIVTMRALSNSENCGFLSKSLSPAEKFFEISCSVFGLCKNVNKKQPVKQIDKKIDEPMAPFLSGLLATSPQELLERLFHSTSCLGVLCDYISAQYYLYTNKRRIGINTVLNDAKRKLDAGDSLVNAAVAATKRMKQEGLIKEETVPPWIWQHPSNVASQMKDEVAQAATALSELAVPLPTTTISTVTTRPMDSVTAMMVATRTTTAVATTTPTTAATSTLMTVGKKKGMSALPMQSAASMIAMTTMLAADASTLVTSAKVVPPSGKSDNKGAGETSDSMAEVAEVEGVGSYPGLCSDAGNAYRKLQKELEDLLSTKQQVSLDLESIQASRDKQLQAEIQAQTAAVLAQEARMQAEAELKATCLAKDRELKELEKIKEAKISAQTKIREVKAVLAESTEKNSHDKLAAVEARHAQMIQELEAATQELKKVQTEQKALLQATNNAQERRCAAEEAMVKSNCKLAATKTTERKLWLETSALRYRTAWDNTDDDDWSQVRDTAVSDYSSSEENTDPGAEEGVSKFEKSGDKLAFDAKEEGVTKSEQPGESMLDNDEDDDDDDDFDVTKNKWAKINDILGDEKRMRKSLAKKVAMQREQILRDKAYLSQLDSDINNLKMERQRFQKEREEAGLQKFHAKKELAIVEGTTRELTAMVVPLTAVAEELHDKIARARKMWPATRSATYGSILAMAAAKDWTGRAKADMEAAFERKNLAELEAIEAEAKAQARIKEIQEDVEKEEAIANKFLDQASEAANEKDQAKLDYKKWRDLAWTCEQSKTTLESEISDLEILKSMVRSELEELENDVKIKTASLEGKKKALEVEGAAAIDKQYDDLEAKLAAGRVQLQELERKSDKEKAQVALSLGRQAKLRMPKPAGPASWHIGLTYCMTVGDLAQQFKACFKEFEVPSDYFGRIAPMPPPVDAQLAVELTNTDKELVANWLLVAKQCKNLPATERPQHCRDVPELKGFDGYEKYHNGGPMGVQAVERLLSLGRFINEEPFFNYMSLLKDKKPDLFRNTCFVSSLQLTDIIGKAVNKVQDWKYVEWCKFKCDHAATTASRIGKRLGIPHEQVTTLFQEEGEIERIFWICNVPETHWFSVITYTKQKIIVLYDPIMNSKHYVDHHYYNVAAIFAYLQLVAKKTDQEAAFCADQWKFYNISKQLPVQTSGVDCGVFAISFFEHVLHNVMPIHTVSDMKFLRDTIALSLHHKDPRRLVPPR